MKFLIDKLKEKLTANPFGDNLVATQTPDKYNDKIAQLNSLGNNQYNKLNTENINRISKINATSTLTGQSSGNSIPPGSR
jgi:hypothetical protein